MLVGMGAWADNWTRCTSASDLTSGGTFIIGYEATANSGNIIPMKNTGGTATTSVAGYMAAYTAGIDMSEVTITTDYEFTVVPSTTVNGAICIKTGGNYIGNTNTKNNCKLFASEANTTSFDVTVGENDVFTLSIAANTGNSTNYTHLQYNSNSGSERFAIYANTQKNLVFYKKVVSTPAAPSITTQPVGSSYDLNEAASSLSVIASGYPTPSYQWYSNTIDNNTSGTIIVGATSSSYTPSTSALGTTYYYCVATNSLGSATSNTAQVRVNTVTLYNVNFVAGAGSCATTEIAQGSKGASITLPTATISKPGFSFVGWAKSNVEKTSTKPTVYAAGSSYTPTGDESLYAVYTKLEGGNGGYILSETSSGTTYYMKNDLSATTTKSEAGEFFWDSSYLWYFKNSSKYYISHQTSGSTSLVNSTVVPDDGKKWTISDTKSTSSIKFRSTVQTTRYLGYSSGFKAYATSHTLNYEKKGTDYYMTYETTTINITTPEGYSTFVCEDAIVMPEGVEGSTVTVAGGELTLAWEYKAGDVVAANTPILVKGAEGNHNAVITVGGTAPASNNLVANTGDSAEDAYVLADDVDAVCYVLGYDKNGENLGFYWYTSNGDGDFKVPAGKVFLAVSGGSSVKSSFALDSDSEADAINKIVSKSENSTIFDLSGRRVNNATKGVYIMNGKKYMVK